MKKLSPKKAKEARINRAIVGFIIPIMSIPKLCKELEAAVVADASDADLKAIVAGFPGVVESN
ncbi:hypothetical protein KIP88_02800 [Bradyrhizobium sp. SRL28]|uniref:hypothetical protein n=1 Tax=Bradyrhizobium sp. SRL28 TaxID=2836178 RepID=UPI001BDDDA53|nr:hypothetical protein [Bradyrhizobium sp. SRL28]MBT1509420.1 hypothetical protein [Bradyrhizobium sp. SRL28]